MRLSRRTFVAGAAGAAVAPRAWGFGASSRVDICELDLGAGTTSRPNAWQRLLYEIDQTTSVQCENRSVFLRPEDPALFEHPFCVLIGTGGFARPSEAGLEQIARYLSYGGFLLVDDSTAAERGPFDASVRDLVDRLFPTRPLGPLAADHSVFRSFFLLRRPLGRVDRFDHLEGVSSDNLTPLVYMRNDLSGALDRAASGASANPCVPGGEGQRQEAIKLGINLVLYSLTSNYKADQAHVKQLMKDGRLE